MFIIGITGMIASGKSTISALLNKKYDAPIFDADIEAKELIKKLKIDNQNVINNPSKLYKVEQSMMPHFEETLKNFINKHQDSKFIVLDIPLLYEFSLEKYCDKIINIYCNFDTRVKRIQNRSDMNIEKFMFLNNKQMNDDERNNRADYTICTEADEAQVSIRIEEIINDIESNL